jgi:hypothetical protein
MLLRQLNIEKTANHVEKNKYGVLSTKPQWNGPFGNFVVAGSQNGHRFLQSASK